MKKLGVWTAIAAVVVAGVAVAWILTSSPSDPVGALEPGPGDMPPALERGPDEEPQEPPPPAEASPSPEAVQELSALRSQLSDLSSQILTLSSQISDLSSQLSALEEAVSGPDAGRGEADPGPPPPAAARPGARPPPPRPAARVPAAEAAVGWVHVLGSPDRQFEVFQNDVSRGFTNLEITQRPGERNATTYELRDGSETVCVGTFVVGPFEPVCVICDEESGELTRTECPS